MKQAIWDWKTHFNHQAPDTVFDCMVAEFLLLQGKFVPSLEVTLDQYGVNTVEKLAEKQIAKLAAAPKLHEYFTSIEMPIIPVLWQMEQSGIFLDVECLRNVGQEIDTAIADMSESMKKEVGFDINLNSSVQIGTYLAENLKVPLSKTKTGKYATNETEISQHAAQFPFIQKLLEYRALTKLRSTYVDTLIDKADDHGRIHTSYSLVTANTGRLSSSNPNLQNIPASTGFGQKIKSCFMAGEENILVSFDYSQQELRILAHLSNEETLIKAFQEKKDIHAVTAAEIFHVNYGDVTHTQRRIAKTINFGVIYGMGSFGMSSQLHISVEEAQKFINAFYANYPNIRKFFEEYLAEGKTNRYVETLLGRRRFVFEHDGQTTIDNSMRRVLINYPIQGSAADLIKKAMITIHEEIVEKNDDCKLLLQIHDDLVFEVKNDQKILDDFIQKVKKSMCDVYPLSVPIEVDVKIGKTWGEMEKVGE
jgi:DNA polymerase I